MKTSLAVIILIFACTVRVCAQTPELDALRTKATAGDVAAQVELGRLYANFDTNINIHGNYKEALKLFREATGKNDAAGQYCLGAMYLEGYGIDKDELEALRLFKLSADQGYARATRVIGKLHEEGRAGLQKNRDEANIWFQKAAELVRKSAEQGDANAQYMLASMYYSGEGVTQDFKQAVYWGKKAAEQGDAGSQLFLAGRYYLGEGLTKDLKQAAYWCQKSAQQGNADAQFHLAKILDSGEYTADDVAQFAITDPVAQCNIAGKYSSEGNKAKALEYYEKSAEQGNADAQCSLGQLYLISGVDNIDDFNKGLGWIKRAAEQGYVFSQETLGDIYYYGMGVTADFTQAVYWYKKAAEQEGGLVSAMAQFALALMYEKGEGVNKSIDQAIYWYQKSAEYGYRSAQGRLAQLYYYGEGVSKDYELSFSWAQKAMNQGDKIAQELYERMFLFAGIDAKNYKQTAIEDPVIQYVIGKAYSVDDNYPKSLVYLKKSAEQGYAEAQNTLGILYHSGTGVTKDGKQAVYWYQKAAEQGFYAALINLAELYYDGDGIDKNLSQAAYWYLKAAQQNNTLFPGMAQFIIANMYYLGEGVQKDIKQAVYWYQKGAAQGNANAQHNLGLMYYLGEGVPKDLKQAVYWYRKSAEQGLAMGQSKLGNMYSDGTGVLKDEVEGLAWYYLARSNGSDFPSEDNISFIERKLGRESALAAQQRAREIAKKINAQSSNTGSQTPNSPSPSMEMLGNGSGVFISQDGLILTAAHVIAGASTIKVQTQQGLFPATVVQVDATNDVALLRCKGQFTAARVTNSKDVRLGRSIFTIGFPQVDLQGFSPKLTKGEISSQAGMHDDPRHWQISAPIQPGNSGGPLFDNNGDVIGIIVSKLDEIAVAAQTGSLSQNVNYALKSAYIRPLLEDQNIPINDPKDAQSPRLEDIAERVQKSVVLIITYGER